MYDIEIAECLIVAKRGMPYNPYRERHEPRSEPQRVEVQPYSHAQERRPPAGGGGAFGSMSSYGDYGISTGGYSGQGVGR